MYVEDRKSLAEVALRGQKVDLEEFSLERMLGRWQERLQKLCRANRSVAFTSDERKRAPDDGLFRFLGKLDANRATFNVELITSVGIIKPVMTVARPTSRRKRIALISAVIVE